MAKERRTMAKESHRWHLDILSGGPFLNWTGYLGHQM